MQLLLQLSGSFSLPLGYRHFVQSMLYDALRGDPAYSASLHNGGDMVQNRHFKLFTFSQLEGSYRIAGGQIRFPNGAALEIRSIHEEFLFLLFRYFTPGRQLRLGSAMFTVSHASLSNTVITTSAISVRTRSPIVAYITLPDGHTRFFSPEDPEFYSLIAANAHRKWRAIHGEDAPFDLRISPLHGCRFRKQVTTYKSTRITAWDGQFLLQGNPEVLNFLYHTGLGAKSSQGFGIFSPMEP